MAPSGSGPRTHLSKSRIMSGLQCEKRLWLEIYRSELKSPLTASQERVFAVGNAVGEEARRRFPGGHLVRAPFYDLPASLRETAALVSQTGVHHIYEAAFESHGTHVKVDVLSRRSESTWDLIEVKSTTSVKDEHITDTAIQLHVVESAGTPVRTCSLMHLNRECRYPDLATLFTLEDVTERAREVTERVPQIIERMQSVVARAAEPDVPIGTHCRQPYECPFLSYCWRDVPRESVFTIPGLGGRKKDEFVRRGIVRAQDVPTGELSSRQAAYVEMLRTGEPVIQRDAIRTAIEGLKTPLHFLDFETCADAIPRFDGLRPWQNYPFQFSLHIVDSAETLTHHEYLHETPDDPRLRIAEALCEDIGPSGTLVAYNAGFEKGVIGDLADLIERSDGGDPSHARRLREMIPRFFDLLDIFRNFYAHPAFLGSNSIKSVLPVLVPELGYDGMAVANGEEAQAVWARLVLGGANDKAAGDQDAQKSFGFEREATLADLRDYCRLDTLAMVRIWEVLKEL